MTRDNEKLIEGFFGFKDCPCGCSLLLTGEGDPMYDFYTESWDWVMAVVSKIEELGYDVDITYSRIEKTHFCKITDDADVIFSSSDNDKMVAIQDATIEFIKWFNEKNIITHE
jgi:hypothetical protein